MTRARRAMPLLLGAAAAAGLALYLYSERSHIAATWSLDPVACAAIAASVLATLALRALANRSFFGRMAVRAPFRDWFALVSVTAFTNYLPLSAGVLAKAIYLKRVHALPYRRYAASQAGLMLITLSTCGVTGLATLAARMPEGLVGPVGAGFALMTLALAPLLLPPRAAGRLVGRVLDWDVHATPGIRASWLVVSGVQVGILLLSAFGLELAFGMGAGGVGFAACLVFSSAVVLTRLVAVTPGALGVRELMIGGLAYLTGFELREAVIATTVVRGVEVVIISSLGAVFTTSLLRQVAASRVAGEAVPAADAAEVRPTLGEGP